MRPRRFRRFLPSKARRRSVEHCVIVLVTALVALAGSGIKAAQAWQSPPLALPLTFGMSVDQAAQALGVPLDLVVACRRDELYLALPNVRGAVLSRRSDGLFLQFRKGRLVAWKGDWGTIRP